MAADGRKNFALGAQELQGRGGATPKEQLTGAGHRGPLFASEPASMIPEHERFHEDGYLVLENVVDRARLAELSRELVNQWRKDVASGAMFEGGGNVSGHLNCFPGEISRFAFESLQSHGIVELVQALSSRPLRAPNIGCNLNLPGSSAQNEHVDGYAATPFLIVNVAAVDTDLTNGATEIMPGTQRRTYKYWEIARQRAGRKRLLMKQGDALVRTSTLWHRGMPNRSAAPRPMLAFTWEDGGSTLTDPYSVHDGRVTFLPNRFNTDWKGRLLERAFVAAPRVGTAYRVAKSLFE